MHVILKPLGADAGRDQEQDPRSLFRSHGALFSPGRDICKRWIEPKDTIEPVPIVNKSAVFLIEILPWRAKEVFGRSGQIPGRKPELLNDRFSKLRGCCKGLIALAAVEARS